MWNTVWSSKEKILKMHSYGSCGGIKNLHHRDTRKIFNWNQPIFKGISEGSNVAKNKW